MRILSFLSGLSRNRKATGSGNGNWVIVALIVLVLSLAGMAIFKASAIEKKVAETYKGWFEDAPGYEKALAIQKQNHQPILIYFYATWCPHCKKFTADILSDKKMQTYVKQFPHVRVAPDNGNAEKQLMREFGAPGYPTFYVVMPDKAPQVIETYKMGTAGNPPSEKTPQEFIDGIQSVVSQ